MLVTRTGLAGEPSGHLVAGCGCSVGDLLCFCESFTELCGQDTGILRHLGIGTSLPRR